MSDDDKWFNAFIILVFVFCFTAIILVFSMLSFPVVPTTREGTVSQITTTWGWTTISFVSNSGSVTCYNLQTPIHIGEHVRIYQPAFQYLVCQVIKS